jgi:hypothetical protein
MWTSMKISHLRDEIKLKLWKVEIPTEYMNYKKMNTLINKPHESINIKEELGGELLNAENDIKSNIDKKPADGYIHILMQSPPLTTTGKCFPMVYLLNKKFALSRILIFLFDQALKGK